LGEVNEWLSPAYLSEIIGYIYDCSLDPGKWSDTLTALRRELNFQNAVLSLLALSSGEMLLNITSGIAQAWLDRIPEYSVDVIDQWGGLEKLQNLYLDEPAVLSRVNPRENWATNRYYVEWAKPQGIVDVLAIVLARDSATVGSVGFGRHEGAGEISAREVQIARLLVPHLQRAVAISRLLEIKTVAVGAFERVLDTVTAGVLLVGVDLNLVYANRVAETMLEKGAPVRAKKGIVETSSRGATAALAVAVSQASHKESAIGRKGLHIPIRQAGCQASVLHVLPLQNGQLRPRLVPGATAAIFVTPVAKPLLPRAALASLFDLTGAELSVLEHMVDGRTVIQTAQALGISVSTVRTHVLHLFEKTGAHRQTDLVAVATSFTLPLTD
jgi:DNA-binding CsgD family transcriptional regulator/PAS domain-containing protein